jgi:hypothetical protein
LIGLLLIAYELPRRRVIRRPFNQSNILINYVEDVVEVTLQEIPQPLDQIPHTPPGSTPPSPDSKSRYNVEEDIEGNPTMDGN